MNKQELAFKIGQNIKRERMKRGLSQAGLAKLCYKDRQSIELIENGKVNTTLYSLYLISKCLDIELKALVDF